MDVGRGAYEIAAAMYEVRSPYPDGDEETAIDETFATEAKAQAAADRLNAQASEI